MTSDEITEGNFSYRNGEGFVEGCSLSRLAKEYGTPLYLYSERAIRDRAARFKKAFSRIAPAIRYSCKANSNLHLLKILKSAGCGADVISGGELSLALSAGFPAKEIIMEGPGKREDELEMALRKGVSLFSCESLSEIALLNRKAGEGKKKITVLLRLNPDIEAGGHGLGDTRRHYISTGKKENKFGLTEDEVVGVLKNPAAYPRLKVGGLHFHLGSQIATPEPYLKAIREARRLHKIYPFEYLDLGGGFPVAYEKGVTEIEVFGEAIGKAIEGLAVKVIFEPGRYLVASAGFLLTRVIYRKDRPHKKFLVVDAGMNDLIRPSLYDAYHHIWPGGQAKNRPSPFDVVGPICESGDFLAKDRPLPDGLKEGDLLLVGEAGAYGFTMASNYNGRLRPAEVLITGRKSRLIRRRETLKNLLTNIPL